MCQMCDVSFVGFAEPQEVMLDSYCDALAKGWSPNTERDVSGAQRDAIAADRAAFLASLVDEQPPGRTRTLDNGLVVPILPQRNRWIWDGDFCGQINLRWQVGTTDLPPPFLGHIGYSIVPWKRGHGLAKRALRHMLSEAREVHLPHVDICTTEDNPASQRVIIANGGVLIEAFRDAANNPAVPRLRYRITLG
jgi:predicted acetyltransferase